MVVFQLGDFGFELWRRVGLGSRAKVGEYLLRWRGLEMWLFGKVLVSFHSHMRCPVLFFILLDFSEK